jgi:hypothetical protein
MTVSKQSSDSDVSKMFPFDAQTVAEIADPALAAASTFQRGMVASTIACQREWLGFMNRRWQENLEFPGKLARCRTIPEFQQAYFDYWTRVADQYTGEFQQLGKIVQGGPLADLADPKPAAQSSATPLPRDEGASGTVRDRFEIRAL